MLSIGDHTESVTWRAGLRPNDDSEPQRCGGSADPRADPTPAPMPAPCGERGSGGRCADGRAGDQDRRQGRQGGTARRRSVPRHRRPRTCGRERSSDSGRGDGGAGGGITDDRSATRSTGQRQADRIRAAVATCAWRRLALLTCERCSSSSNSASAPGGRRSGLCRAGRRSAGPVAGPLRRPELGRIESWQWR